MPETIRKLTEDDWRQWRAIRLEALKLHPEAFASSYDQEKDLLDEEFKKQLIQSDIFGAFENGGLVGTAGFFIFKGEKVKHKGCLYGMYLKNEWRGGGMADALVKAVINHAKQYVMQIHCSVITDNQPAIKLYEKNGFKIYGNERNALKIDTSFYDEHLMFLLF